MIHVSATQKRSPKTIRLDADLVIVGGGMAGTCCAITAARQGIKVVLIQDRPVLGGNASSEVRLWILGATSHMGNNNRWAREGGVIDEILVENTFRNPEGNGIILDTILFEKVLDESNITLLLNTAVYQITKASTKRIESVIAFCSQNSTRYEVKAPLFCDASGDGVLGFLAGAAFRMGAEAADEFDEPFAPSSEYGELLGHSIYFMTKDVGKPVKYIAPNYAIDVVEKIPRYRKFNTRDFGAHLWWIEYGGRLDTVHDTETIKWELWKVVYGVWDYIKNSGEFPEAETMTLEWVGLIPGKRESRRFEGHYMLKQSDFVQQHIFEDAVGHGGWAVDLHPADGVFSEKPGCNQWHSKGVYQIPLRCMISQNIENLFLAGRILSASHVAMGSTRVMATCAHNAQAAGMAAAMAIKRKLLPTDLLQKDLVNELQLALLKSGQYIPHHSLNDPDDLAQKARIQSYKDQAQRESLNIALSSELVLHEIPFDGQWAPLTFSSAQMLPLEAGAVPQLTIALKCQVDTELTVSLRISSKAHNFTPDITLETHHFELSHGEQYLSLSFKAEIPHPCYAFICFHQNEQVAIKTSESRITGILSVFNKQNKAVSNYGKQEPDPNLGFEAFEFWVPIRRPEGHNFAMRIKPGLTCFGIDNLTNGIQRPVIRPNAWVADARDKYPEILLEWEDEQCIQKIALAFDTDFDHPQESAIWGHPERIMPFTVREYRIYDDQYQLLYEKLDNHQTLNHIQLNKPIITKKLLFRFSKPLDHVPVSVFEIRCYSPD